MLPDPVRQRIGALVRRDLERQPFALGPIQTLGTVVLGEQDADGSSLE